MALIVIITTFDLKRAGPEEMTKVFKGQRPNTKIWLGCFEKTIG